MARRRGSRTTKIQPAVESFTFIPKVTVPVASAGPGIIPGTATYFVDLSQCASLANRRFYRQGILWAVSSIRLSTTAVQTGVPYPAAQAGKITISKLPQTWIMSNAWEKSFRAWSKMNREALSESSSVKPKFLDFKIYADADHHSQSVGGFPSNLLPVDSGGVAAVAGEWEPSKFVIPKTNGTDDTISHEIIAVGSNYPGTGFSGLNAVSLIEGYAASRGLPDILDPNTPDDAALASGSTPQNYLSALFNEGTDQTTDVIDDMIDENNIAPYPFENDGIHIDTMYPGGANNLSALQIHSRELMTGTTVGNQTYLKGGSFPCGLIKIEIENYDSTYKMQPELVIDLVPGTHRGYLCESMTEM